MENSSMCLVVDASCDLPPELLTHPQIRLLPVRVFAGEHSLLDTRDVSRIQAFYETALKSPSAKEGHSEPLSVEEMENAFAREIALKFDEGLGVFVASSRSAIYARAKTAVAKARLNSYTARLQAGRQRPLQVDCVDSKALFAGYAAQVLDLFDLLQAGAGIHEIIERQRFTVNHTFAYMVPGNVSYLIERASLKGEKSVGAIAALAAKVFSIIPVIRAHKGETAPIARKLGLPKAQMSLYRLARSLVVENQLLSPHLCLSYSGNLLDISESESYQDLCQLAKSANIHVHLQPMSMTGSVNVGPNALVVGCIAKDHDPIKMMQI